jgi:hypothetical protein
MAQGRSCDSHSRVAVVVGRLGTDWCDVKSITEQIQHT